MDFKMKTFSEFVSTFPNEWACIKYLEKIYWNDNPVSPFDPASKVYKLKNNQYRCKNTGKNFNVKVGTMFEGTKISLHKWFITIWMLSNTKQGISSYHLSRQIGVTQKTAWFMLQKIRFFMANENGGTLTGEVEMDETYIGGKNKNRHYDKKVAHSQGRSHKDKTPVLGMVERGGRLIARVVEDTTHQSLIPHIKRHVSREAVIYTDEHTAYKKTDKLYTRFYVDHHRGQYADGNITTNRIENSWKHLKRMVHGTYLKLMRKYLHRYVDEFVFRFNLRELNDSERFNSLLCSTKQRMTHNQLKI